MPSSAATDTRSVGSWLRSVPLARLTHVKPLTASALASDAPQVLAAERALRRCGYEPRRIVTGGGRDANAFEAAGFACTNLANGTQRNHEPTERVSVAALEGLLDVTLALLEETAA